MTDLTEQTSFTADQELDVLATLEHLNGSHPDTVLFVARHLGGPAVEDAEVTAADRHGATFTARVDGCVTTLRAPFDQPLAIPADLLVYAELRINEIMRHAGLCGAGHTGTCPALGRVAISTVVDAA